MLHLTFQAKAVPFMLGRTLGHYRIVAKIGAGGMGELYRAHDEHLDRDVALKLLPVGVLGDEGVRKRFRKEALALSKLNHPNIATVFDFDTQDGVDFLAMELIPGSSLSEKLKGGPLPEQDVIRLGTQFAEGLAAAHAQGIVHRDLKPGNLIVTPEGRLKILDFGLATLLHPSGDPDMTRSITETQSVLGTLPYMSPEQLRGQPTDARSDVYACGAVLYEMATGRRLFQHLQGAELIGAILHQSPLPPSTHNRLIMPGLESVVLKALDKDPTRRYQSARELLVALEGVAAGVAPTVVRSRWRLVATASAAVSVVLLVGSMIGLNVGGLRHPILHHGTAGNEPSGTSKAPVKARRAVAVLGFKNVSGRSEEAWLSTAISEMLTTELTAGEQLRTVPGENVAQMKINLSLPDVDSYGKDTLARIRKNLNTDYVVLGSYLDLGKESGGQIRLDLRLQDAAAGETLAAVSETGTEAGLLDLVSRTGARLRKELGVGEVSPADAAGVRASLPTSPVAARLYSEGIAKLRFFDALAARDLLQKAVVADPNYPLAHATLAAAWSALGYDEKAKDEAKKAFDLSGNLSREERLAVEGRYRETTHEWSRVVEIYRTLVSFFPDSLDYGLRLAAAQTSAGKGKDALATVEALRKLSPPARDDPRIDLAEALAAQSLADFRLAQAVSERAATRGEAQGSRLVVAGARLSEGRAFDRLGEVQKARTAYEEARRIYAAAGDRAGVAKALNNIAILLYAQGDLDSARAMYEQSLAVFREVGSKYPVAALLSNIGTVFLRQGNLGAAKKMFSESLAIWRQIDAKIGMAMSLNNLGLAVYGEGDLARAKKSYQESLAIGREIGDRLHVALALHNLADVAAAQGDLAGAKKTYLRSLTLRREMGDKSGLALTLNVLAELLYAQGDLVAARRSAEEALAIRNQLGQKGNVAQSGLMLASLAIEEGRPSEAEVLARKAVEEFRAEHDAGSEVQAEAVLARSFLAQNQLGKARETIGPAAELAKKSQDRTVRFAVDIVSARVRAALAEPAEANASLEDTVAEAKKYGFVRYQFEAGLALGEIEMKSGKAAAGRAHLAALQKDATATGFLLIARKATAARK